MKKSFLTGILTLTAAAGVLMAAPGRVDAVKADACRCSVFVHDILGVNALQRKGEEGKKKITQITRYITIAIAVVTALGYYFLLSYNGALGSFISVENEGWQKVLNWLLAIVIVACYCAGSSITMWLAERINDKGIGNGISVILFANIVSKLID